MIGNWFHTMIIGPPQTGKTTLLRDIARIISSGDNKGDFKQQKSGSSMNGLKLPAVWLVFRKCPLDQGLMSWMHVQKQKE